MSTVPWDQVAAALDLLAGALGRALLGAYLYGSAIDGGLRPASDLDLLGVLERRLLPAERRRIIEGLLPLSGHETRQPGWRPIELTLVVRDEVRPWRYPPRLDLQYGEWLRAAFLAGELEPWPRANPDLALLVTIVLARSEVLIGPPAPELLDRVPREDLMRAMRDEVPALLEDLESDTRNVLLTLARMWMTAATGNIRPKDVAAEWALRRVREDHRYLLLRARAGYLGEADDAWDDPAAVRSLADLLRDRIAREVGPLPPADPSV